MTKVCNLIFGAFLLWLLQCTLFEVKCQMEDTNFYVVHRDCLKAVDLTKAEFDEVYDILDTAPDLDIKLKCYMYCFLKGSGLLDAKNKFNGEFLVKIYGVGDGTLRKKIDECVAALEEEVDICEYCFKINRCIVPALNVTAREDIITKTTTTTPMPISTVLEQRSVLQQQ